MDDLIHKLVAEHQPRPRLVSPEKRVWVLGCAGVVFAGLILVLTGRRTDAMPSELLLYFSGEMLILGSLLIASLYFVLLSVVPGERTDHARSWSVTFALIWFSYLVLGTALGTTPNMPLEGLSCLVIIGAGAVLPLLLLTVEARKGLALKPEVTGLGIALCSAVIAVLGLQAHCEWESALHHIVFHFVPVMLIALMGLGLRNLLKDDRM